MSGRGAPSGELVAAVLTLVRAIAGICGESKRVVVWCGRRGKEGGGSGWPEKGGWVRVGGEEERREQVERDLRERICLATCWGRVKVDWQTGHCERG